MVVVILLQCLVHDSLTAQTMASKPSLAGLRNVILNNAAIQKLGTLIGSLVSIHHFFALVSAAGNEICLDVVLHRSDVVEVISQAGLLVEVGHGFLLPVQVGSFVVDVDWENAIKFHGVGDVLAF